MSSEYNKNKYTEKGFPRISQNRLDAVRSLISECGIELREFDANNGSTALELKLKDFPISFHGGLYQELALRAGFTPDIFHDYDPEKGDFLDNTYVFDFNGNSYLAAQNISLHNGIFSYDKETHISMDWLKKLPIEKFFKSIRFPEELREEKSPFSYIDVFSSYGFPPEFLDENKEDILKGYSLDYRGFRIVSDEKGIPPEPNRIKNSFVRIPDYSGSPISKEELNSVLLNPGKRVSDSYSHFKSLQEGSFYLGLVEDILPKACIPSMPWEPERRPCLEHLIKTMNERDMGSFRETVEFIYENSDLGEMF